MTTRHSATPWPQLSTILALLTASTLLGTACSDGATEPPQFDKVVVAPATVTLLVGTEENLGASARDGSGRAMPGHTFEWTSSDETIATVEGGLVTGVAPGSVTITATGEGKSGSATVTVEEIVPNSMSQGLSHSCGLTSTGAAYCWGANSDGQLGDGSTGDRHSPVAVVGDLRFEVIDAGDAHTVGITADGSAYAWGSNDHGQLGTGDRTTRRAPAPVQGGPSFRSISAGAGHTVALTADGAAYAWGDNEAGQLGDGTTTSSLTPVAVTGGLMFRAVNVGARTTVAITLEGDLYAWGSNEDGKVGDGTRIDRHTPTAALRPSTSPEVPIYATVSVGGRHVVALTTEGEVFGWGYNGRGALGSQEDVHWLSPGQLTGGIRYRAISAGSNFNIALTVEGEARTWGSNNQSGQLGRIFNNSEPVHWDFPVGVDRTFRSVSAGGHHGIAFTASGAAYTWGNNDRGQLGDGTTTSRTVPAAIAGVPAFR